VSEIRSRVRDRYTMGKDRSVARNVDLVVCQLAVPAPAVAEGFFLGAAAAVVDWVSDSGGGQRLTIEVRTGRAPR